MVLSCEGKLCYTMHMHRVHRRVVFSVTNFIHYGDEFLMLHRSLDKSVDAGRLNGIGGKLEKGENFVDAAIRETAEESGYQITPKDLQHCGIVTLHGGYAEDWVMCFFKIAVSNKNIPLGTHIPDGELMWMHKENVLTSGYELVDDLNYCWEEILKDQATFFATTDIGKDQKVKKIRLTTLHKR